MQPPSPPPPPPPQPAGRQAHPQCIQSTRAPFSPSARRDFGTRAACPKICTRLYPRVSVMAVVHWCAGRGWTPIDWDFIGIRPRYRVCASQADLPCFFCVVSGGPNCVGIDKLADDPSACTACKLNGAHPQSLPIVYRTSINILLSL